MDIDTERKVESWKSDTAEILVRWMAHRRSTGAGQSYDDFLAFLNTLDRPVVSRKYTYNACQSMEYMLAKHSKVVKRELLAEVLPKNEQAARVKYNWAPTKSLVKLLASRDGFTCKYCGCALVRAADIANYDGRVSAGEYFPNLATVDHVIPRSRGGGNELENLVLCCHLCNSKKGNR